MSEGQSTDLRLAVWAGAVVGFLLFFAYGLQVTGLLENALVYALIPFGGVLAAIWLLGYRRLRARGR